MLHWPDSMLTYVGGMNVLLSSDAFGQHYTTSQFFNDEVDTCILYQEALKYYANILTPYSRLIAPKVKQLMSMDVPIEMIAPGHGLIWRENPMQIVDQYLKWADAYNEGHVMVLYDTMWGNTEKMAHSIADGLAESGVPYKIVCASNYDVSDLVVEAFIAKGILVGSSTINNGMLSEIVAVLDTFKGMRFCGKKAAAFGSYGWSGEASKLATEMLKAGRFEVVMDPLRVLFTPDEQGLADCHQFGLEFGKALN